MMPENARKKVVDQIREGKCTPVISNQFFLDMLFGQNKIAAAWAAKVGYPLGKREVTITEIAQYQSVETRESYEAKKEYQDFLKEELLRLEREKPKANRFLLDQADKRKDELTFTELVMDELKTLKFATKQIDQKPDTASENRDVAEEQVQALMGQPKNPLEALALLNTKAYVTTSPHFFLERALKAVGKTPQILVYCWNDDLEIPNKYDLKLREGLILNDVNQPLVYHLFGVDDDIDSLVLTEDDHLQFLIKIWDDFRDPLVMPTHFRDVIQKRLLLLLGYEFNGWDLRMFLKGLMRPKTLVDRSKRNVAIQIDPTESTQFSDPEDYEDYLDYVSKFYGNINFDLILDKPDHFIIEVWKSLNPGIKIRQANYV
jgi:hypothetical protein